MKTLTQLFVGLILFQMPTLALTQQGKEKLNQIKLKSKTDQVSELVTLLSLPNQDQEDRALLAYYTAKLAFEINHYEVSEQFYKELSQMDNSLSPIAKVRLHGLYCDHLLNEDKCERGYLELKKDSKIRKLPQLSWSLFQQMLSFHLQARNWSQALKLLRSNSKSFRSSKQLQKLAEIELKIAKGLNQTEFICKSEKTLFIFYPLSSDAKSPIELVKSCPISVEEKRQRIKRMLMLGHHEKILNEINSLSDYSGFKAEELKIILADYHLREGNLNKTIEILEELIHGNGESLLSVLDLYALALSRSQRFQEASQVYQKIKKLSQKTSEKAQATFDSAFVLYQGGLYNQAIEGFGEYLNQFKQGPRSQEAKWYLGWLAFLSGQFERARLEFENLAQTKNYPEKNKVFYWLAKTYWQLNYRSEAIQIMTLISQQQMRVYNYYVNSSKQWLLENSFKSSMTDLIKVTPQDCLQRGCSALLNFETRFIVRVPDLTQFLNFFDNKDSPELGELNQAIKDASLLDSVDLQTLSESQAYAQDFTKKLRFIQSLVEIEELDLALNELKSLYYRSSFPDQKLSLLKVLEGLKKFDESARLAELYLLNNPKSDRLAWITRTFPKAYSEEVDKYSKKFGVEKSIIFSIIRAESFFNPQVESPVHARGLMQLMPFTANQVLKSLGESGLQSIDILFDPETNIKLGSAYLSRLLRQFDQNYILAAAAYNAGPHRVQSWLYQFGHHDQDVFVEHIPFKETRGYVKKVMGFMEHYGKSVSLIGPINVREVNRMPASKERWDDI
jgi:soluble lytic murein transglycosylase